MINAYATLCKKQEDLWKGKNIYNRKYIDFQTAYLL